MRFEKGNQINKGRTPWNKGKPMSGETRHKLSESLKGRNPWNRGIPRTPEVKAKLAAKQLGKKLSPETRKKMSETHKRRLKETGIKPSDWGAGFANTPWSTKEYTPTRFAYFAGLFDGEGSVMIMSSGSNPVYENNNYYKKVQISFSMTDKEPLSEGYKYFGGSLHFRPQSGNKKSYWQWKISSGKQIDFFLRNIRKYLRIKGNRVDLALQYRQRLKSKINVDGRRRLTETELLTRNNIEQQLKKLNKRGRSD